jgi:hypothetical protein
VMMVMMVLVTVSVSVCCRPSRHQKDRR